MPAGGGFFSWVKKIFGGDSQPAVAQPVQAVAAPVAAAAAAATEPAGERAARGERGGRNGGRGNRDGGREGGRDGRRGERGERAERGGERGGEGRGRDGRGRRNERGERPEGEEAVKTDALEARGEARGEARPEGRGEARGEGRGEGRRGGRGPTVREVVEFTRIVHPQAGDVGQLQVQVSPDGRQAFIVTRTANTLTDRNLYRILLLDLDPERLAAGRTQDPEVVATLDPVLDNNSAHPAVQDVQWVGPRTLAFRARTDTPVFQVYAVDTVDRRLEALTSAPTDVVSFSVSQDLRRVVYTVQIDNPPLAPGQRSVVVGNQSFWNIKFGQQDRRAQLRRYQHFVVERGNPGAARALGAPFDEGGTLKPPLSISPDGRWALLPRYEPERQVAWGQQYPLVADATARVGPGATVDPLGYFSRPTLYVPRRLVAYRLDSGAQQPVVDAPDDAAGMVRPDLIWQPGGSPGGLSVIIAGTHLPLQPGASGDAGQRGSHVIEYWPDSGQWSVVTHLQGRLAAVRPVPRDATRFVVVDASGPRTFARRTDGRWAEEASPAAAKPAPSVMAGATVAAPGWSLKIHEGLDVPPDIVAQGPRGEQVALTQLNPGHSARWGTMRPYAWKDAKGRQWNGGLMVPAGHDQSRRHALVIQTYGFAPDRFYLDGANTAIGFTSGFPGRALLREQVLVLALPSRASTDAPTTEAGGIAAFMDGVRGAIDALVAEGLVDRERIGIMGWSMTGERVLNQVTFSDAPIRAATILDGDANTLFSLSITYAASDGMQARKAQTNLGLPFGPTLANWLRSDPSLHTDCIRAALRIETYGPWVLNNWDIYALLRRQYKPVEMVVVPDGTHGLLTPSERMLSLQGNVDWFGFWLKDGRRTEPVLQGETAQALAEQYRRWDQMAELKRVDDTKPMCARAGR